MGKCNRNLPLFTYSALSDFPSKGGMWRRKGNPHLVHILSYSETSPKERGNVAIVKRNVVTEKGECCDGKGK